MKPPYSLDKSPRNRRRLAPAPVFRRTIALFLLVLPLAFVHAAQLKEARVSQVIKDVKLLPPQAAPRPAALSDQVRDGTAVRTGGESRAELTFTDQTLARLGANTVFSFDGGTRNLELGGGAMLLRVPKNAGGAQINTAAITAAITGTTILLEFHPGAYIKFIVLEGTGRIFRKDHLGESVLVHAGQMMIVNPKAKNLPDPVDVDLKRLMETSKLITDFGGLASSDLIARAIQLQLDQKSNGGLVDTNLVIFGRGTVVALLDPTNTNIANQANSNSERQPTASPTSTPMTPTPTPMTPTPTPMTPTPTPMTPTPTPGKFGTPSVIAAATPYEIGSGTVIETDPTITTNGKTDFGTIYRGLEIDGLASLWFFGGTSEFDAVFGFDQNVFVGDRLPIAALKFSSLQLTGNPTIVIGEGGPNNLALISVGDLTSGPPGGSLTFSGLNFLYLGTQDGSITLTSDLAFQDIPALLVYARGTGSNLIFDASVTGATVLGLLAEGDIQVTDSLMVSLTNIAGATESSLISLIAGQAISVGDDLSVTIDDSGVVNGGAINLISGGDLTVGGLFGLTIAADTGDVGNGSVINVNAGQNLTAGTLNFTIDNSAQHAIQNGGSINLSASGDLTIAGDAVLSILNNGGGHIVNGGNIALSSGGDLTANSIAALVNNRDGGTIDNGGNLTLNVGGALTTSGDASFIISNRDDGGGGGTITQGGAIVLNLGSVSIGGELNVGMGLSQGGTDSDALASIFVAGDLTTGSDLFFDIQNGGLNANNVMTGGLIITNDILLSLAAANVTTGDFLDVFINNLDGGQIGNNATVIFGVNGDISIATDALWEIFNNTANGSVTSSIGSDATIAVTAGSISAGSILGDIFNTGGATVGNDASLAFAVTGAITSVGNATFRIVNFDDGSGYGGGTIGGNADISIAAQSLSAATLLVRINNLGGTIGGSSTINLAIGGALTTTGDATINILGDSLTTPGAAIIVTAASFNIAGSLNSSIGDGTTAFNIGSVTISATNDITVGNQIIVAGSVAAGGKISATNGIAITGGSLTAGGDITSSAGAITQSPSAAGEIGTIFAGGNIFAAGGLEAFYFNTSIIAGGSVTASDAAALTLQAGTNMTIGNATGSAHFIFANTITAGGALSLINVGTIQDLVSSSFGDINFTPDPFTLTVNSISGAGPALASLLFNGFPPDPNFGNDNPGNGGLVTLNLLADGLTIGSAGDIASIDANGGDFALDSLLGGNGGTVNITATGDVNLTDGNITATSGGIPDTEPLSNTMGNGGTVNVTSSGGTITVASKIEASSDELEGAPGMPLRRSAKGGNISLTSTKATAGVAINVSNSGQLLALLDQAAPGPGGKITILASGGGGSSVNVNGYAQADRGTVDIRHTGANGTVNLGDASGSNFVSLHGDLVKAGALGNNGILTVGQGFLSANDTLKLYGASANGEVRFIDNVTIGGTNFTIIAANTVTINNNKIVTVQGARADVYTGFNGQGVPNANYTGSGGNGTTTGTFSGAGANNPQPIANAPPFDGPPGG